MHNIFSKLYSNIYVHSHLFALQVPNNLRQTSTWSTPLFPRMAGPCALPPATFAVIARLPWQLYGVVLELWPM